MSPPTVVTPITILPGDHVAQEAGRLQNKSIGAQVDQAVRLSAKPSKSGSLSVMRTKSRSLTSSLSQFFGHRFGNEQQKAIADHVQAANLRLAEHSKKDERWIINPNGRFMQKWDVLTAVALIFTSIVTPFEVGFLETKINFLFAINRFVDVVFLSDMLLHFFLAIEFRDYQGVHYIKDHRVIARHYIGSWFCLDFTSCLPFDFVGVVIGSELVQSMRFLRIIRLFRLLKLVRILRASRIMARWQTMIVVPFTIQSLIKFAVLLMIGGHWMACAWGLVGMTVDGYTWIDALRGDRKSVV